MNVFKFELKSYIKSTLIWGSSVSFFLILYMAFFPAVSSDPEAFVSMMEAFPEEVLDLLGMNPDLPIMTVVGYYSLTMTFVMIPVAIQASHYGFSILSVEERELTADFLLTKPISRRKIFLSKFSAASIGLIITNATMWIASIAGIALFKENESPEMFKIYVFLSAILFFQLFFLCVGMMISVMVKKIPSVISFSMGLGFGMYILAAFGKMLSSDIIGLLSPFNHFDPAYMLVDGTYHIGFTILSLSIIIISFIVSYILYQKRNIASL